MNNRSAIGRLLRDNNRLVRSILFSLIIVSIGSICIQMSFNWFGWAITIISFLIVPFVDIFLSEKYQKTNVFFIYGIILILLGCLAASYLLSDTAGLTMLIILIITLLHYE